MLDYVQKKGHRATFLLLFITVNIIESYSRFYGIIVKIIQSLTTQIKRDAGIISPGARDSPQQLLNITNRLSGG
jgi:hypothetical protein